MRTFEAMLVASMALAMLRGLGGRRRRAWPSSMMALGVAAILVLHLAVEGWRPQMLPAYLAVTVLIGLAAVPGRRGAGGHAVGRAATPWLRVGGLLSVVLAAGLSTAHPVITTPPPRGFLAVGTLSVEALDGDPALLIWFPARAQRHSRDAPYRREPRAPDRRASLGRTQSMLDALPVASPGRLPVLVFFPGWGTLPSSNTVLLQDLASYGFAVVAVDAWDAAAYPGDAGAAADLAVPLVFDSDAEAAAAMAAGARNALRQARLARRVLDRLDRLDADRSGSLAGRLALAKVGMLGFSFGGSVAVQTALDEPRVAAVANLDGGVFTDAYRRGFDQPYLLLGEPPVTPAALASPDPAARREAVPDLEDEAALQSFLAVHGGARAIVAGAAHGNFTDAPLLPGLRRHGGRIDPERARAIIDDVLLVFFERQLRAATPIPSALRRAYPELTLQLRSAGSRIYEASSGVPARCSPP